MGRPVFRRPALEDVTDIDVVPSSVDCHQDLIEKLTGSADERLPLQVLIPAGRLTDKYQIGIWITDAEDELCPCGAEGTLHAFANLRTEIVECAGRFCLDGGWGGIDVKFTTEKIGGLPQIFRRQLSQ
jgi:hypothetical protein